MGGEPVTEAHDIVAEIHRERYRQDKTWGEQNHPDGTGGEMWQILANTYRRMCQDAAAAGQVTWRHILMEEVTEALAEGSPSKLRAELIQVAAVAAAWVEAIDRRTA